MRKYVLSASLLTMLASSALAEEALQYRDCRQSEGRLGWFAVSYTINDGKRTEKSAQDLNKACTRLDYEDSRQVAKSWGEKTPPLQGQSTDNQRRDTSDTRDDTSNGRQSRDDTSDRRGPRSGSDVGGGRDFGGSRDLGSGRDLGSRTLGSQGGGMNVATSTQSTEGTQNHRPPARFGRRNSGSSFGGGHYGSNGRFYGSNRGFYGSSGRFYGSSGRFYGGNRRFYGNSGRFYGNYGRMSMAGRGYYRRFR
jgi:hypothetical protein